MDGIKLDPDAIAWMEAPVSDRWVFDKLLLSTQLGYVCGPAGVPVPKEGEYIVRPITNIGGMSAGAQILRMTPEDSIALPPGYFWCEVFEGNHYSVDYLDGKVACVVLGTKREDKLRFDKWKRMDQALVKIKYDIKNRDWMIPFQKYKHINVEVIGSKIIEVHLRANPNPVCDGPFSELKVVWEDDDINIEEWEKDGWTWIEAKDDALGHLNVQRLGFLGI